MGDLPPQMGDGGWQLYYTQFAATNSPIWLTHYSVLLGPGAGVPINCENVRRSTPSGNRLVVGVPNAGDLEHVVSNHYIELGKRIVAVIGARARVADTSKQDGENPAYQRPASQVSIHSSVNSAHDILPGTGLWVSRKEKTYADDYFLAGRTMTRANHRSTEVQLAQHEHL